MNLACRSLIKKECMETWRSPFIYIAAAIFSSTMGWLFFNYLVQFKNNSGGTIDEVVLRPLFGNMCFIFLFIAPLLTMGSFSEERKNGTLDLLLMSKLSIVQIIFSKFVANFLKIFFILLGTVIFPIILKISGYTAWGLVSVNYLGLLFCVSLYLITGLFFSSLTDNPIMASILTFTFLIAIMLLVISVNATANPLFSHLIQYHTIPYHYESFSRGVINSFNLVFIISYWSLFFLATKESLEARKC